MEEVVQTYRMTSQKSCCFLRGYWVTIIRMHIPKSLAVVFMATLSVSSLNAQSADTDVQAKAREKLRQAMAQADGRQGTASDNVPAKPAPVTPAATKSPATVTHTVPPPTVVATPSAPVKTATYGGLSPEAEAKAREKLREAAAQLEAQQPQQPKAAAPVPEKPKAVVKAAPQQKPIATAQVKTDPKPNPKVSKTAAVYPGVVDPPASAAPSSKAQRLDELLRLYRTDKITPADYHQQRAKILAEP